MKGRSVGSGGLHEKPALTVYQRVRRLVHDDVMRKTGEYRLTREVRAGVGISRRKIAEEQPLPIATVVSVSLLHRMRKDAQARAMRIVLRPAAKTPLGFAPEGKFETPDGLAGYGVNHLLMKARVRFTRLESAAHQHRRII